MPAISVRILVRKISKNFRPLYFTIMPTLGIRPTDGYIPSEHQTSPKFEIEGKEMRCEVYSRTVGYLSPVGQWNGGKKMMPLITPEDESIDRSYIDHPNSQDKLLPKQSLESC